MVSVSTHWPFSVHLVKGNVKMPATAEEYLKLEQGSMAPSA
jgi:hypothetical protein